MNHFIFKGNNCFNSYLMINKYINNRVWPLWFKILTLVCVAIILVFYNNIAQPIVLVNVLLIALVLYQFLSPYLIAFANYQMSCKKAGAKDFETELVVSDKFYFKSVLGTQEFELSDLKEFGEYKNNYVFVFKKLRMGCAGKDILVVGEKQDFEEYMHTIAPQKKKRGFFEILNVIISIWLFILVIVMLATACLAYFTADPLEMLISLI